MAAAGAPPAGVHVPAWVVAMTNTLSKLVAQQKECATQQRAERKANKWTNRALMVLLAMAIFIIVWLVYRDAISAWFGAPKAPVHYTDADPIIHAHALGGEVHVHYEKFIARMMGKASKAQASFSSVTEGLRAERGTFDPFNEEHVALEKTIKEREKDEECMDQTLERLGGMQDYDRIKDWVMDDQFEWSKMLAESGLCEDRNDCLCDILLGPQEDITDAIAVKRQEIKKVEQNM